MNPAACHTTKVRSRGSFLAGDQGLGMSSLRSDRFANGDWGSEKEWHEELTLPESFLQQMEGLGAIADDGKYRVSRGDSTSADLNCLPQFF